MPDSINVLTDIETVELTLCRRGKNNLRWALSKSEGAEDTMNEEILKAILEIEADNEDQIAEIFKALSAKGQDAVKGALRVLSAYREELPGDVMSKLTKLAGFPPAKDEGKPMDAKGKAELKKLEDEIVTLKKAVEDAKGDPAPAGKAPIKKADGTWDLSGVSDDLRPALEQIWKDKNDQATRVVELEKSLKAEQDKRETAEWVSKAADLAIPDKTPEELGAVLKRLHDVDPQLAVDQEKAYKDHSEALKKSALLDELGRRTQGQGGTAMAKMQKLASGLVQKSASGLTDEQAFVKIMDSHPELYAEYLDENPAQTGYKG